MSFTQLNRTKIAVTVDDLPFARISRLSQERVDICTKQLMLMFQRFKIPVVGFVNQSQVEVDGKIDLGRLAVIRHWVLAGLELGNHTYSHPSANQVSAEHFIDDIIKGEPVIRELMREVGRELRYFRHPYLRTGSTREVRQQIEDLLAARGYTIVPVTFDNSDWLYAAAYQHSVSLKDLTTAEKIGESYLCYMKDLAQFWRKASQDVFGRDIAQILLIHANQLNADYGDRLWQMFTEQQFEYVPVEQAMKDPVYESVDSYVGPEGISWILRWAQSQGYAIESIGIQPEVPKWISELVDSRE